MIPLGLWRRCWRNRPGDCRTLVSRDEAQRACAARWLAGIAGMIDAIRDRHLMEVERAYPVQASHVDGIQVLVGSPLMMGVDSAAGTEEVLRRSGMEAVAFQRILALQKPDPAHLRHDNDGAAHPAVRAGAAEDRIETVAERRLKTHRAAMALAGPDVGVAHCVCLL
jgi:hypothetical protein